MSARLRGRVALVTGSSSGIGRAIATLFAEEGADLVLCDLRPESRLPEEQPPTGQVVSDLGASVLFQPTDVSVETDVERAFAALRRGFGRLDVLVNCAGVFVRRSAGELEMEEWRRVLDVNLTGYLLTVRAALPLLR